MRHEIGLLSVATALLAMGCAAHLPSPAAPNASQAAPLEAAGATSALPFLTGGGHTGVLSACAKDPTGRFWATGGSEGTVQLLSSSLVPLARFLAHAERVESLTFDDHGTVVASASGDGTVALWRTADGHALGRAGVVMPDLPAPLYGVSTLEPTSSWRLEFRGESLWLIDAASFANGSPAYERLVGRLVGDGFVFSARRELEASRTKSKRGSGHGLFVCQLPEAEWKTLEDARGPGSDALSTASGSWIALSRLVSNAPQEERQQWLILPTIRGKEALSFGPYPGRLERLLDTEAGPAALFRTDLLDARSSSWALFALGPSRELLRFETRPGPGAVSVGSKHVFGVAPDGKLEVRDLDGSLVTSLSMPNTTDARAVAASGDEQMLAYATETALFVRTLAGGGTTERRFTGPSVFNLRELRFTEQHHWLLAKTENGGVMGFDVSAPSSATTPIRLALESPSFLASRVLRANLATADGMLLRRRADSFELARIAGSTQAGQPRILAASPSGVVFGLRADGRYLLEALATGDVVVRDLHLRSQRVLPNPVGHPRQIIWLPHGEALLVGIAGAALLRPDDLRLLQLDVLADAAGALAAFAFDPRTAQYAGQTYAVRRMRLPLAAETVSPSPLLLGSFLADFFK